VARQAMRSMDRRTFLRQGAALSGALIAARGAYASLEQFAAPPRALAAATPSRRQEQYLIDSVEVILDNGTPVAIPPLYNDVFTAKLAPNRTWSKAALLDAQKRLEAALQLVEKPYPATAAGLTIVVAWGLPYFRQFVPGPWQARGPRDTLLPKVDNQLQHAVLDAIRFPSDPGTVVLEDNHVAFKIRSDSASIVRSVETQLFGDPSSRAYVGDILQLTSKRIGFAGRGFGTTSAAKTLALQAGVPGADAIPDRAQLTMGFTSTQPDALGPDNIPSFETLKGVTDQFPSGYFAHGCAMHLSHLYLDLDRWYRTGTSGYAERVQRMFSPRTNVPADGTVTIPNGPAQVATLQQVREDAAAGKAGHNSLLQMATRLQADAVDNYGRLRRKGTAVPAREDFNTLDAPFTWYVDENGAVQQPAANRSGLHFAVFVPSSSRFHAARMAMDGVLPNGMDLRSEFALTDDKIGINSSMSATHRQNYLVPPRARRAFPLAELL
jgi:hypothetical protein